jgi:hypothetical protein
MNPFYQLLISEEYLSLDGKLVSKLKEAPNLKEARAVVEMPKNAKEVMVSNANQIPKVDAISVSEQRVYNEPTITRPTLSDADKLRELEARLRQKKLETANIGRIIEKEAVPTREMFDPCATMRCAKDSKCIGGKCVPSPPKISVSDETRFTEPETPIKGGGTTINIFGEGTSTTTSSGGVSVDTATGEIKKSDSTKGGKIDIAPKKKDYLPLILLGIGVGLMIIKPLK